jgi:hypothetical protein
MALGPILDAITQGRWVSDPAATAAACACTLSKKESQRLQEAITVALGQGDVVGTTNALLAGIIADTHRTLHFLRRGGMLRPSKNRFDCKAIRDVLSVVCSENVLEHLPEPARLYLDSLRNLHAVGIDVRRIEDALVEVLHDRGPSFLKRLFAAVELMFMADTHLKQQRGDRTLDPFLPQFWTREEMAEAFSYLAHLVSTHFGQLTFNCPVDDAEDVETNVICALVMAAHVRKFQECEALVDGLQYRLRQTGDGTYVVEPSDPTLERSIRLGYMLTEMRFAATSASALDPKAMSLRNVAELVDRQLGQKIVQHVREPFERFRFAFPLDFFTKQELLPADAFFAEEIVSLQHHAREWMVSIEELLAFEVVEKVRVCDLIRVQRVCFFLAWCTGRQLLPRLARGANDPKTVTLIHQSAIAAFTPDQLRQFISGVLPSDRVDSVLSFLTWAPDSGKIFDVQYQPFIRGKNQYFVSTSIAGFSSIVQNAVKQSGKSPQTDPTEERFPAFLRDSFARVTQHARGCVSYSFQGVQGELDIAAKIGDTLFVFEVKCSLLPANVHELRTSWDHACQAHQQLDRFCDLFPDPAFRSHLEVRLRFPLNDVTRLQTGIVLTNRMFAGFRLGIHPIRGAYELDAFLTHGTISVQDEVRCFWEGTAITADDLIAFLDGDLTMRPLWSAMSTFEETYRFQRSRLIFATYRLDYLTLAEAYGFTETARQLREEQRDVSQSDDELSSSNREKDRQQTRARRRKKKEARQQKKRNRR